MNEPQQPSFSNSDRASEQADLNQLDDLLDDLLNLQQELPEQQSQLPVAATSEQNELMESEAQVHSESENLNASALEHSDSFLSPFLASREARGIPEFEISQPASLVDTVPLEADQSELSVAGPDENSKPQAVEQSDLNRSEAESVSQALPEESDAPMMEPLNNTNLAGQAAQEIPLSKLVASQSESSRDTQSTQIVAQAVPFANSSQAETADSLPARLNVRPIEQSSDNAENDAEEDFRKDVLQAPFVSALSSQHSSAFQAETPSSLDTPGYQDMHHAMAKQSKMPFLASSKLWLILALVGLGAGGGVAIWQKLNQPRVSFNLSGQDLGTDFLEPDPLASALPSGETSALPSAEASGLETVTPTASSTVAASPSVMASAPTELLLWARIKQASVNLRSAPGKQANVLMQPKINQKFILTGQSKRADDLDWAEIQLDESKTAWVSTKFIEIMPGEKVAPKASAEASTPPTEASQDEYTQAAQVVAQLLKAPGTVWPKATPELQHLTVMAMLKQIFKDKPESVTPERIATLQSCLDESARAENLKKLKVYEIAVACTLALNWR